MTGNKPYSAYFMSFFLTLAAISASFCVWSSLKATGSDGARTLLNGKWTAEYEQAFDKQTLFYKPATALWSILNYALYKNGADGVLIGENGWLFTTEEFAAYPDAGREIQNKIDYIQKVKDFFDDKNIALLVLPVPAKARLYREHLGRYRYPAYNENTYNDFRNALRKKGIAVADVLWLMEQKKNDDDLFLRTDTHWTPAGAKMAASAADSEIKKTFPKLKLKKTKYETTKAAQQSHEGDLMRYIPLGFLKKTGPSSDALKVMKTHAVQKPKNASSQNALFGDTSIPVTLVGTSYSANPLWNFDGFLKEALQADILNAASEGLGPFETMQKYLKDEALSTNPPKLVIWEIPERYLAMKYNLEV